MTGGGRGKGALRSGTAPPPEPAGATAPVTGARVSGVDVARGLALFGMMATHVFDTIADDGSPTTATVVAAGRSAATFALIAGVSVAFLSGGRRGVHGRDRTAAAAGLAVRAGLIGAIGLLLGTVGSVEVILPFYALMFLLAVPLLPLRPRTLAVLCGAFAVAGPVLLVTTARLGLEYGTDPDLTPLTALTDPLGTLLQLLVTGAYPVVVYLAYLCAGLAIGRLDLTSRRVAGWLLGGGLALAVTSRLVSWVLLGPLGGLDRLVAARSRYDSPAEAVTELLWQPEQGSSWWYLAVASPHAHSPLDVTHVLGSAMVVLGGALLLTSVPAARRLLQPLAAAGAMTLTLYSAHVLVLAAEPFDDSGDLYLFLVLTSLAFAVLWRRDHAQGPLERWVGAPSTQARRAVLDKARVPGR
ncbi:MAG: hypothetical protein JWR62_440 [Modestobacter sp.]|nr:hypothetical protein [Modestobacter sp.]